MLDQSRQHAVFERLRQGILSGTLAPGQRLPPTRRLAEELGLARQTVVLAYERLAAEGYVRPAPGSGTYVARDLPDAAPPPARPAAAAAAPLSRRGAALAAVPLAAGDQPGLAPVVGPAVMVPGVPAADLFPRDAWFASSRRAEMEPQYPDLAGQAPLRAAIAAHLASVRGLLAEPEQILVTAGTQQALFLAASLLLDPGDAAWVEDPGYIAGRGALLAAGAELVPVPSDGEGLDVAAGIAAAPNARLALVAPSHATPLGGALPVARRLALLDWAARAGAWVLEDDCDSEFRWEGKPLPPLASLDRAGRVIHCGTFSKTLAPALRLGFVVVPPPLLPAFRRARGLLDRGPPAAVQATLATFMQAGRLASHVRRARTEIARRRSALLAALARHAPGIEPVAAPGGLHMVLRVPDAVDELAVANAARARGLGVVPLGGYFLGPARFRGLVAGFADVPVPRAAEVARAMGAALRSVTQRNGSPRHTN